MKQTIEGKTEGGIDVTGRRERRRTQLLDDLKETRGYWKFEKEAPDRTQLCTPVLTQVLNSSILSQSLSHSVSQSLSQAITQSFIQSVNQSLWLMTSKDETHSGSRNVVGKFTSHTVQNP
jgi:hypothetical protein